MNLTEKEKAIITILEDREAVLMRVIDAAARRKNDANDIETQLKEEKIIDYYNGRLSGYFQAVELIKSSIENVKVKLEAQDNDL